MTHFPAGGQSAGHGKIAEVSWDPWIVPRTNTCRHVIKVNLTLTSFTHFVAIRQIVGQWPPRWLSCCRLLLLLLLLRRWLWLPMTDRSSSERRSRRVRRRHRIQTVTLLNRNRRMSFITLSATMTASAFSTIAGRNWAAAAARLSSTTTLYDGPGPLTTSRFRIHVIPTATGCSPFLPTCNQNNENKIFEFIPICCCFFYYTLRKWRGDWRRGSFLNACRWHRACNISQGIHNGLDDRSCTVLVTAWRIVLFSRQQGNYNLSFHLIGVVCIRARQVKTLV